MPKLKRPKCACGRVVEYSHAKGERGWRKKCWHCRQVAPDPSAYLAKKRRYAAERKKRVLAAYGGKCTCCGETEPKFLTIDHVKGHGNEHRRALGLRGYRFYRWLEKEGWPPGYTVLCFNCNCGRYFNGGVCPHKKPAL